ncbi:MAG: TonB-dependent receptor [Sphingomonas adhaesiva]|uniref:TonB-dependent receptor n=1 Tax=Sphingomonas adhaesiva TaxID=28212 RepID=UPI002FF9AC2D
MKTLLLAAVAPLALAPVTVALPAAAQDARQADPHRSDDIIVSAPIRQSEADVLQGTSVLAGENLTRELRSTIGETLARLPGVSSTSFGPNASRPILRGFQGDRIRVLTDGIGSIDVSNTSVDHAVIIDPLLSERVEVLRGPAALLYGSSAVGGVVNVVDRRIPRSLPEKGYRVDAIANYGSAADERSVAGSAEAVVAGPLVLHVDGSYLKADDLRIGGFVLSRQARREALASVGAPQPGADEPIDFAANAALRGRLPNTAAETWTAGAGAAIVTDGGTLGVSYGHYDSLYGLPVRYATQPGQEQEAPRLDVVQNRYDLRAEVTPHGSVIDAIRLRAAHANYRHFELEEDGAVGTAFYNKGLEGRLEVVQAKRGGWQGASGAQYFSRAFNVVGDEAFLPRNDTQQVGLFTLQQYDDGRFKAEGGVRYENTVLSGKPLNDDRGFFAGQRRFDTWSGSIGAGYALADGVRIGLNGSRTERAPSAEELFANGPHAGTQAYELGNPDFRAEKSWGLEATFHAHSDTFSLDASAYYNWFDDYIYETRVADAVCEAATPSGDIDGLPCFQYSQAKARYYGFEADASARLATVGAHTITADLMGDYVHATVVDRSPVPRIPPLRVLGGLEARSDTSSARVEVEHAFAQRRVAPLETTTDGYTMVNASLSFRPWGSGDRRSILLAANNIFDVEARRSTSVLKDFAPLAGRDIRVTLRVGI